MAELTCPYDDITLRIAIMSASEKMDDVELAKKIHERLSELHVKDKADLNKKIAEHNGVSVLDIINSPNYETLKGEYSKTILLKTISVLKEESFSDKEAWAIVAVSTGSLT